MFVQSRGLGGEESEVLCRLLRKHHLKKDSGKIAVDGYQLQLNAPLTSNNPGLLAGNLLSFPAVLETLVFWDIKRQSMVGVPPPSEQESGGASYHHPCPARVRAPDLTENSAMGIPGSSPALLLSAPGGSERAQLTPAHTAGADSGPKLQSSCSELPLTQGLEVGLLDHGQPFPGPQGHSPCHLPPIFFFFSRQQLY